MKISIIIPAFNEELYIERCLSSVLENGKDAFFEIIVVDNASTDATVEIARRHNEVRVVSELKKGSNSARQRGFLEAKGDIVAYLDADMEVTSEWFASVRREFSEDPKLVCLSGPFYYYDLSKVKNSLVWVYWNLLAFPVYYSVGYMAGGGNCAIRRDALERIGGFDTDIEFYGDDTNTARRLYKEGKVKFTREFEVYTSGRRFHGQGFFKTGLIYGANFWSEALLHRPITKAHKDIR